MIVLTPGSKFYLPGIEIGRIGVTRDSGCSDSDVELSEESPRIRPKIHFFYHYTHKVTLLFETRVEAA